MSYKQRTEPTDLLVMKSLNVRMTLSEEERNYYENRKKGYEGEVMFDELTEQLQCEALILNDLLLKINNTYFQIDTTIIFKEVIHLYDVKNFEGDYFYENGKFYASNGSERKDPLLQLKRSESLFRQLLHTLGYKFQVEAYVVHVNPECTLYQVPRTSPIIFPTQLNKLMKKLNNYQAKLNDRHIKLADQLISMHIADSPFKQLPAYTYERVQKGVICGKCYSFSVTAERFMVCEDCGHHES